MESKLMIDPKSVATDVVPTYIECVTRIYEATLLYIREGNPKYSFSFTDFIQEVRDYGEIKPVDLSLIFGCAVVWTLLRYVLTRILFSPFAKAMKIHDKREEQKLPESMWKTIVYCCTWALTCYTLFGCGKHNDIFHESVALWRDWKPGMDVGLEIYIVYMVQLSFYLHSVYATLYMDEWRKDSFVMLFHHFLTMSLVGFSYVMRYHKIGLLVLFVHDVTDICLEFTKCNVYLKKRNGNVYKIHDHLSTFGFICFSINWFVFRLYWFPLKVLYSTGFGGYAFHPLGVYAPCSLFFNVMLWILQGLNIYWFKFIIVFLYRVLTGQMKEVDDVREHDVEGTFKKNSTNSLKNNSQSHYKHNGNHDDSAHRRSFIPVPTPRQKKD